MISMHMESKCHCDMKRKLRQNQEKMIPEALSSQVGSLHQGHLSASHSEFGKEAQGKIFISQLCVKEIETKPHLCKTTFWK